MKRILHFLAALGAVAVAQATTITVLSVRTETVLAGDYLTTTTTVTKQATDSGSHTCWEEISDSVLADLGKNSTHNKRDLTQSGSDDEEVVIVTNDNVIVVDNQVGSRFGRYDRNSVYWNHTLVFYYPYYMAPLAPVNPAWENFNLTVNYTNLSLNIWSHYADLPYTVEVGAQEFTARGDNFSFTSNAWPMVPGPNVVEVNVTKEDPFEVFKSRLEYTLGWTSTYDWTEVTVTTVRVPENGNSLIFTGLGLLGLYFFARKL